MRAKTLHRHILAFLIVARYYKNMQEYSLLPTPAFFFFKKKKRIEKKKGSTLFCKLHLKKKVEKEMIISPDVCQFSWNPLPFRYTLHLSSIVGFALSVISPVVIQDLFVYQSLNLQFAKNLHIEHYF